MTALHPTRRRVLFIGEAVTLAHVVRPVVLARALDPARYAVTLACDDRYLKLFGELPFAWRSLATIPTVKFLDNLARGRPVYDADTLRAYVRDDLALIEAVKPDRVVGDFRISLGVSARVAGVPYWMVTNAYWSPYSRPPFPLPEHPMILRGLAALPVAVIAATAGQPLSIEPPKNVYVADFLPGIEAAARAALVICNGGSLATQQALAAGAPEARAETPYDLGKDGFGADRTHGGAIARDSKRLLRMKFRGSPTG
jgi:UDP:flavonoid glycosyltransferase YjiC (YdhE family)